MKELTNKEWDIKWRNEENNDLINMGLDPVALSKDQRRLILQLDNAPEDYYQDGEISDDEAFSNWRLLLRDSGLSKSQVTAVVNHFFN